MTLPDDLLEQDPALADLFSAERRRPGPLPGTDARVKAAVLASIAATAAVGSGAAAASLGTGLGTGALSTSGAVATSSAASTGAVTAGSVGALAGVAAIAKPAGFLVAAVVATAGGTVFVANYDVTPTEDAAHVVVERAPLPTPPPGLLIERPTQATTPKTPTLTTPPTTQPTLLAKKTKVEPVPVVVPAPVAVPVIAPVVVETPAERTARLAAERSFIAEARAALSSGNAGGALLALEAHKSEHLQGALAEEREALMIMALARAGRVDEARARATTFSTTWPKSLFAQAVSDAVGAGDASGTRP